MKRLREIIVLLPRWLLLLPVIGYRLTISKIMPPICRFEPSCSEYMYEALKTHGALRGLWLGTFRLLRCQPFCEGGWDPVPPKREG